MAVFSVTVNQIGPTTTVASRGEFFAGAVPVASNGFVYINAFTTPTSPFGVFALASSNNVRIIGTDNVETINASLIDPLGEVPPGSTSTPTRRDNLIFGNAGDDTIFGGAGDDFVDGGLGDDVLNGGDGADTLDGDFGNDVLNGGDGADSIVGGAGNDVLNGGDGNDIINGSIGADILTGGSGADVFVYFNLVATAGVNNVDTITDFNPNEGDRIRVPAGTVFFDPNFDFDGNAATLSNFGIAGNLAAVFANINTFLPATQNQVFFVEVTFGGANSVFVAISDNVAGFTSGGVSGDTLIRLAGGVNSPAGAGNFIFG